MKSVMAILRRIELQRLSKIYQISMVQILRYRSLLLILKPRPKLGGMQTQIPHLHIRKLRPKQKLQGVVGNEFKGMCRTGEVVEENYLSRFISRDVKRRPVLSLHTW